MPYKAPGSGREGSCVFLIASDGSLLLQQRTLILLPEEILITFAVMLAGGVLASFLAIWRALRAPPALALGA